MLEIVNVDKFISRLISLEVGARDFLFDALKGIAMELLSRVRMLTPVDTGNLRRKWSIGKAEKMKDTMQVEIINNTEYAMAVEKGGRTKAGGFIQGRHMLSRGLSSVERSVPGMLEQKLQKFMERRLNG